MKFEEQAARLAEPEANLASALHNYFRALSDIRTEELLERLERRFKDPAVILKMKALLNGE